MEPNLWAKFKTLVQESLSSKFKVFFPGCLIGLFGAKSLLFAGLPAEIVTFGAYCIKFVGTLLMSAGSGLATTWGAKKMEKWLGPADEKKNPPKNRKNKAA